MTLARGLALFILLALAIAPQFVGAYEQQWLVKTMILVIFAMSLDLLIGVAGMVSFGHALFFGLAGYLLTMAGSDYEAAPFLSALGLAVGGAALAAFLVGWLSARASGVYFIMITLAFAQMGHAFFSDSPDYGGSDGAYVTLPPMLEVGDVVWLDLGDKATIYYLVLVCVALTYLLLRWLMVTPFGRALAGIRENENRMRACGAPTLWLKVAAFTLAGALAGLAGFLEAAQSGFVSPDHMSWRESGLAIIMVMLGGKGVIWGAALGAVLLSLAQDQLSLWTQHWHLILGGLVILTALAFPQGLAGALKRLTGRADRD